MTNFHHLLSAGTIGPMALRNRVVLPGMDMNRCHDGEMTEHEIEHYAARAAGGCGLITTGASSIAYPYACASRFEAGLSDDRFLPGLTRLADAVHAGGAKLSIQLVHHSKVAGVDTAQGRPLLVPSLTAAITGTPDLSALADNSMEELMKLATATQGKAPTYHVATTDDIAEVIEMFADAAARVQTAGADAVEIHGAHGYLINTFLSRAFNERTDEYGGSLENRCRLLVEVIQAVRARVGQGMAISVRLNGCEFDLANGITIDETVATARIAEAAGADVISVSAQAGNPFRDFTLGPLPSEVGHYRAMAGAVKAAIGIPVIAVGRLLPEIGEEMLANGECDFVAMGRQQLADPQLVNKLASGRRQSIRPCVNCYVCVEQNFFDGQPYCAVNPALGNESAAAAARQPADGPRHVVVVGAGPAGLETARIAARRGHRVTVVDRRDVIGGSTWFAALSGSPNQMLVDWLAHEVGAAEVDVRLGENATVESVTALQPDVVVLATGAEPALLQGLPDSLDESGPRRITVLGGDMIGLSVARYLADQGHTVTVREPGKHIALGMAMPRRWRAVYEAREAGITLVREADLADVAADGADELVIDTRIAQNDGSNPLRDGLRAAGIECHVVGDASGVGYLQGAMHGAHEIATKL